MAIHPIGLSLHSKMYAANHTVRNGFQITERQWTRARLAAPPLLFCETNNEFRRSSRRTDMEAGYSSILFPGQDFRGTLNLLT
jgi:hypothetical protein